MARPKFFDSLDILKPRPGTNDPQDISVCAMGPLEQRDELVAMRVWVWQEAGAKVAASAGNGGDHLGGHDRVPTENFPLKGTEHDRWMIQTKLEANSPQFVEGVSALATAMALVRRDGSLEVEHWSQSVMIGPHEHDHGGATHEHPHGATT